MKQLTSLLLLIILSNIAFGQSKIDTALQKKILVLFNNDQKWRIEADKKSAFDTATINRNMFQTDSLSQVAAKAIIAKYGFPGYSLVGEDGSNGFWALIQHCDNDVPFQQKSLKLMSAEVKKHNASGENFALLQDRVLVNTGHKQIYGTQVRMDLKTNKAHPFPIQDSLNVDARRKAVGLMPLNDYLKLFEGH